MIARRSSGAVSAPSSRAWREIDGEESHAGGWWPDCSKSASARQYTEPCL